MVGDHAGVAGKHSAHSLPLHADPTSVDQAHLLEPGRARLVKVRADHIRNLLGRERVEVEVVLDRQVHRLGWIELIVLRRHLLVTGSLRGLCCRRPAHQQHWERQQTEHCGDGCKPPPRHGTDDPAERPGQSGQHDQHDHLGRQVQTSRLRIREQLLEHGGTLPPRALSVEVGRGLKAS